MGGMPQMGGMEMGGMGMGMGMGAPPMGGPPMGSPPEMGMMPQMAAPPQAMSEMPFPGSGMGGEEEPAQAQSATMKQSIGFVAAEHLKKHLDREAMEAQKAAAIANNTPPEAGGVEQGAPLPGQEEPINGPI